MIRKITFLILLCSSSLFVLSSVAQQDETEAAASQTTTTPSASAASTGLTITTDGVTTTSDASPSEANANDGNLGSAYVWSLIGVQRRVEIDFLEAPQPVPCEVNYYKDSEAPGAKTTLWSAFNDGAYCEFQAKTFIEKLESMSWDCSDG